MKEVKIGAELEAGLLRGGLPAKTLEVLNGGFKSDEFPFEGVTSDLAESSIEFITTPCEDAQAMRASLARCLARVPEGYEVRYGMRPLGCSVAIAPKPRYPACNAALLREHPNGAASNDSVAPWASLQFHFGTDDPYSPSSILLLDCLNNSGPYIRKQLIDRYRVEDTAGHVACWLGWSIPQRVPAPRWFGHGENLKRFIGSIPKLVTEQDGFWMPAAEGTPSRLEDPEAQSSIWWLARPRIFKSGSTVELRCLPSITPEQTGEVADEMFAIAHAFNDWTDAHRGRCWGTRMNARELFTHLSKVSPLVPKEPLSDKAWWDIARQ
ncbi:MAG: hypothetical protein JO019_00095 [Candidatus Kaiserbacteria bacterium]|nr:hypothetical protein [Candidatus Kaiserbacteria bacterium]